MTAMIGTSPEGRVARRFPPIAELATACLALVVIGGIVMASYIPRRPPLAVPVLLLAASAVLLVIAVVMLARLRDFAWGTFFLVGRWALLAYVISAGMIEFAFVRDHTRGATLTIVTSMLVIFAVDIPLIIAFTVARYSSSTHTAR
ncbi:MAG: hypothetical protein ACHQNA_00540 [Acidimicrobiales bacterium]